MSEPDQWTAGFICAVATMIRIEGLCDTTTFEVLNCINVPPKEEIDEMDRTVFEDHGVFELLASKVDSNPDEKTDTCLKQGDIKLVVDAEQL